MRYCVSCYGEESHVFSIPLKTSAVWLKKTLRRKTLFNGDALTKNQVEALRCKLPELTELGWDPVLEYYLEGIRDE